MLSTSIPKTCNFDGRANLNIKVSCLVFSINQHVKKSVLCFGSKARGSFEVLKLTHKSVIKTTKRRATKI